ncbi:alanine racemase [Virgibacillus sp. NKC19-3]|uniref:alanine racemase n=1 Tax=Virgibacillus saliphilus TaxID=2831674 RepID=UPI001C9A6124|nr:alanine racemase [Virgibacillus sp. NKC19-3]MBY7142387.1 alanine racemase [Virgibacillus sp. NKC19-3]
MTDHFYRDTWVEVNLDAIAYNIEQMKEKLPESSNIIAVVKADGYGHGSVPVAKRALEAGANALAVALLEEALVLRKAGIEASILVLGRTPPEAAPVAADQDITLTFFQEEWLREVETYKLDKNLKVHMKWDTGMGRIGIRNQKELKQMLDALNENPSIYLTGVFTHFATADEEDLTYFYEQKERFDAFLAFFKEYWPYEVAIHIGNSAASIRLPEDMYDFIRFGISMYGLYPSGAVKAKGEIDLKQAFSLHSRLISVKRIAPGESVSYGATYTAKQCEWIGTIPIGYGDGWIRKLQGASVLVDGKRMPIVGRICMDQTMIQLDREYPIGTKVTLIGAQDGDVIDMDEIANYVDTINYEIPCIINNRVPRIYTPNQS